MKDSMKILFFLTGLLWSFSAVAQEGAYSFKLKVFLEDATPSDTLILELIDHWTLKKYRDIKASLAEGNAFLFQSTHERPQGFWKLYLSRFNEEKQLYEERTISTIFYWEHNDDVSLHLRYRPQQAGIGSSYDFKGQGAAKYQVKADIMEEALLSECYANFKSASFSKDFEFIDELNPCFNIQLNILEKRKDEMSQLAYSILEHDIRYQSPQGFGAIATLFMNNFKGGSFTTLRKNYFSTTQSIMPISQHEGFLNSYRAIKQVQRKIFSDIRVSTYPDTDVLTSYYDYVKQNTDGEARERLIIDYFANYRQVEKSDSLISDAFSFFKSNEGINELTKLQSPFKKSIGKGYSFTDHVGQHFELDSLYGKVILVDVYNPGCIPCIHLYQNVISKIKTRFKDQPDFVILSLSVERKNEIWQETLKSGLYTSFSPNTINVFTGEIGRRHPFLIDNELRSNPSVLLINQDGITRYLNNEILFDYTKLAHAIENLL